MANPFDNLSNEDLMGLLGGDSLTFEQQMALATAPRSSSSSSSSVSSQNPQQFAENMALLREQLRESALGREQKTAIDKYLAQLQERNQRFVELKAAQDNLTTIAGQKEGARQANLRAAVDQYQTALSLIPQMGQLSLMEAERVQGILQDGGDFLARAFESRGGTSPLAKVTQADQINAVTSTLDRLRAQVSQALQGGPPNAGGYEAPPTVDMSSLGAAPTLAIPTETSMPQVQQQNPVATTGGFAGVTGGGTGGAPQAAPAPAPAGFGQFVTPFNYGDPAAEGNAATQQEATPAPSGEGGFVGAGKTIGKPLGSFLRGEDPVSRGLYENVTAPVISGVGSFLRGEDPVSRGFNSTAGGFVKGLLSGFAEGGMTREGAFVVGDHPSGVPVGTEELVVNPTNAPIKVIPNPETQQMMGGFARYAEGTDPTGAAIGQYLTQMRSAGREAEALAVLQSRGYSQSAQPDAQAVAPASAMPQGAAAARTAYAQQPQAVSVMGAYADPLASERDTPLGGFAAHTPVFGGMGGSVQEFFPDITPYMPDPNSRYDATTGTMYQDVPQGAPVGPMGPQAAPSAASAGQAVMRSPADILQAVQTLQGDELVSYLRSLTPDEYGAWASSRERAVAGEPVANTIAAAVAGLLGAGVAGNVTARAAGVGQGESVASKLGQIGPDTVRSLLNNSGVRASYIARRLGQIGPDTIRSIPGYALGTGGFSRYATGTGFSADPNWSYSGPSSGLSGFFAAAPQEPNYGSFGAPDMNTTGGKDGLSLHPSDIAFRKRSGQGEYAPGSQFGPPRPKVTQKELVDMARRTSPPALQALFNNTAIPAQTALRSTVEGENVFLKTPTARQWLALTPEERKAAEARYNVEFNAGAGFVPNRIAAQYGSTGSRQRGFVGAAGL